MEFELGAAVLKFVTNPKVWIPAAGCAALAAGALYVHVLQDEVKTAKAQAATSHTEALVASSQTAVTSAAAAIADQDAQHASVDINVHQENEHAIQDAPGASAAVDPALNLAGRDGLCRYAVYATDPYCVGLLSDHSAIPAQTGAAGGPTKP